MRDRCHSKAAIPLTVVLFLLGQASLSATPADQLGKVHFPTTCSSAIAPTIEKGVALLHSFQYKESEQTFTEAATREPKCAIAHWGKAMALYHQLWDFPVKGTLKEGRKEIDEARKVHSVSPREKGFIAAAAAFFRKKSKLSHADRTKAYSAALEEFYAENPGDSEIASFYALSLVSLADEDVDATGNLQKAIAILNPLLEKFPDHPGVAHYLIHAAEMRMAESHYQTHAMDFLNYSYLQSGQETKAREVIADEENVVGAGEESKARQAAELSSRTALELHRWTEAAALPVPEVRLVAREPAYHARALGKAHLGDVAGARADLEKLKEIWAAEEGEDRKLDYPVSHEKHTSSVEVWILFAEGKHDEALQEMRAIADRQDSKGIDSLAIPAREMLADMLLELKRPADALAEYKVALKNSPNRFDSLLGAARAAEASGDSSAAQSFYEQLAAVCPAAADRPELAEVKTYLARK